MSTPASFGGNEWLIEELFTQYQKDKSLVDPTWWEFFEDYRPAELNGEASTGSTPAARNGASAKAAAAHSGAPQNGTPQKTSTRPSAVPRAVPRTP